MKFIYLVTITLLLISKLSIAQVTFVSPPEYPGNCMMNVNDSKVAGNREDLKRAVFTFSGSGAGGCTGTLINRNTSENTLGTYFVTSWHCFKDGSTCGG